MRGVRTHDYRIDGYGNVVGEKSGSDFGLLQGIFYSRFGAE